MELASYPQAENQMDGEMIYCLAIFLSIIFLSFLILYSSKKKSKNLPPSPPSLPIIGHLHLLKGSYHHALESLSKRYGPVLFILFGQQPFVVVSSPRAVEQCFTQNDIILANRPKFLTGLHLGYNFSNVAWAPYGDHWRNLRKVMTIEALSSHRIQQSSWIRQEETNLMVRDLVLHANTKVNLTDMFYRLIHNVAMRTLNGEQWDARRKDLFPSPGIMNICDFVPLLRWVGYKGIEKRMIKLRKSGDEYLQGLLDKAREGRKRNLVVEEDGGRKKTLLEQLLQVQQDEPEHYTDDILKGIISIMLTAGTHNSAKTLEWIMSLLLSHPRILEKARIEIDSHVGTDRLVSDIDLPKLTYLRCIINETLRLYPVVPLLIPHLSSQDCTIDDYYIPRGTVLLVNAWALHRSPDVWDDPTEFKPERFINANSEQEGFKFMPFGVGRRGCPGTNLSMRTISLAMAALIQCFDWERMEPELGISEGNVGTTMPKDKPLEVPCNPRSIMIKVISQI